MLLNKTRLRRRVRLTERRFGALVRFLSDLESMFLSSKMIQVHPFAVQKAYFSSSHLISPINHGP